MHVMVFEPQYKGHHLSYVQMLLPALVQLGCRVTLAAGPDVLRSQEFDARLKNASGNVEILEGLRSLAAEKDIVTGMAGLLRDSVERARPDHVLIPTADGLVQKLGAWAFQRRAGFVQGIEVEANLLRCRFAYRMPGLLDRMKLALIRKAIAYAPVTRLWTIDVVAWESLQGRPLGRRIGLLPDPLETVPALAKSEARRRLGIPVDGRYVVLAGVLDERKGVDRLLAAASAAKLRDDDRVLIAGRPNEPVRAVLDRYRHLRKAQRLVTIERFLTDAEIIEATAAADVLCAPYIGHVGPSAMISRAVVMGRPVIASDFGWMGSMVPRLHAGWIVDTANSQLFGQLLERSLSAAAEKARSPVAERLKEYLSIDNFVDHFLSRLRERMALPKKGLVSWESVLDAAQGTGD